MKKRKEALESLLSLQKPIPDLKKMLAQFEWDSPELSVLTRGHIKHLLEQYLTALISEAEVEAWANMVKIDKNPMATATRYERDGKFVVRDDQTGEIFGEEVLLAIEQAR